MEPQKSNGALIGSIIIVVILVLGGAYLWKNTQKERPAPASDYSENEFEAATEAEIEAELQNLELELENLDAEL